MPSVREGSPEPRPIAKDRTKRSHATKPLKTPHKAQSHTRPHKSTPHTPKSAHKRKIKVTSTSAQAKRTPRAHQDSAQATTSHTRQPHRANTHKRHCSPLYTYIRPIIPYQPIISHISHGSQAARRPCSLRAILVTVSNIVRIVQNW